MKTKVPARYRTQAQSIAYEMVMTAKAAKTKLLFRFGDLLIEVDPRFSRQGLVSMIAKQLTWVNPAAMTPPQFIAVNESPANE